jgi:hypothetical protein
LSHRSKSSIVSELESGKKNVRSPSTSSMEEESDDTSDGDGTIQAITHTFTQPLQHFQNPLPYTNKKLSSSSGINQVG